MPEVRNPAICAKRRDPFVPPAWPGSAVPAGRGSGPPNRWLPAAAASRDPSWRAAGGPPIASAGTAYYPRRPRQVLVPGAVLCGSGDRGREQTGRRSCVIGVERAGLARRQSWRPAGRMPFVPRSPRGPFRGLPREVPVLTAVAFTVALGFGIVAPDIPAFARHFGVSTAEAASVVSAFALMRIVGALPAGRLVDRFGEPAVMATGITIVAVSSILAGFSGSFAELIILRGAGGLGSAMFGVSAQTLLLVSVPSEQRGRASGAVRRRVPGRRDQRPGARRDHRRLVDAGAVHHLRRACSSSRPSSPSPCLRDGSRRRGPGRRRAARNGPSPRSPARCGTARTGPRRPRISRTAFATIGVRSRHRAAVRPRRAAPVGRLDGHRVRRGRRAERRDPAARRAAGRPARPAAGVVAGCLVSAARHGHARARSRAGRVSRRAGRPRPWIGAAGRRARGDDRRHPGRPGRDGRRLVPDGRRHRLGHRAGDAPDTWWTWPPTARPSGSPPASSGWRPCSASSPRRPGGAASLPPPAAGGRAEQSRPPGAAGVAS